MPGIFEMMLIGHTPESLTDWHRRFIELFEALHDTGYSLDYKDHPTPAVRYLPVGKTIDAHPMALPSDKLEVVFDQFEVFGIGQCQCRMAMQVDRSRLRQTAGQLHRDGAMGRAGHRGRRAPPGLEKGSPGDQTRGRIARHGQLDDERAVDPRPMLLLVLRLLLSRHAGRQRVQRAGHYAPPHFLPRLDASKCTYCGKCAQGCPMGAIVVDTQAEDPQRHLRERCIGCGLCVLACDRQHALVMEPVPDYRLPYRSWYSLICPLRPRHVDDQLEALAAADGDRRSPVRAPCASLRGHKAQPLRGKICPIGKRGHGRRRVCSYPRRTLMFSGRRRRRPGLRLGGVALADGVPPSRCGETFQSMSMWPDLLMVSRPLSNAYSMPQ